jgi:hypothetical protein
MKQNAALIKILLIVSIVMLLLCLIARFPYSYYVLLRLVIFITSGLICILAYKFKKTRWMIITGLSAFLFNPIFPVYLNKSTWKLIDLVVAVLFIILLLKISDTNK